MLSWIREKFGKVVISGIIGFIAFVFVFYGVFSPKSTRGLHDGAVAGTVNGDSISITEFNRELNRRIEYFKQLTGGKLTDDQLKAFRIRDSVFQELVNRRLLIQQAHKEGILASDEEVKAKIQEIPAFLKEGKFDLPTYRKVLESNNYNPGIFEKMVREDISLQQWNSYFSDRVRVSEDELKHEFGLNHNQRNLRYVLFTPESASSAISVNSEEIKKFLADPAKLGLLKAKFERAKDTTYKGKTLEAVQETLAHDVIAGDQLAEIQKVNDKRADQVLALVKDDRVSDTAIHTLFPKSDVQAKTTGFVDRQKNYLQGVGDARDVLKDAFSSPCPIELKSGGKPKKYNLAGRVLVAWVIDSKVPDFSQFNSERQKLFQQAINRKTKSLFESWLKKLIADSKIEPNTAVVGAAE
jgi:parvulin-like peptidyl-prolyl isomerase